MKVWEFWRFVIHFGEDYRSGFGFFYSYQAVEVWAFHRGVHIELIHPDECKCDRCLPF